MAACAISIKSHLSVVMEGEKEVESAVRVQMVRVVLDRKSTQIQEYFHEQ